MPRCHAPLCEESDAPPVQGHVRPLVADLMAKGHDIVVQLRRSVDHDEGRMQSLLIRKTAATPHLELPVSYAFGKAHQPLKGVVSVGSLDCVYAPMESMVASSSEASDNSRGLKPHCSVLRPDMHILEHPFIDIYGSRRLVYWIDTYCKQTPESTPPCSLCTPPGSYPRSPYGSLYTPPGSPAV